MDCTTIKEGEYHPSADMAMKYLRDIGHTGLVRYAEIFASCALSGNRQAEICHGTIQRLIDGDPVSDRYLLGLAWAIREMEENHDDR